MKIRNKINLEKKINLKIWKGKYFEILEEIWKEI